MLLGIILLPLLARFSLICIMWAFLIIHVISLWGERIGLSFWVGTKGLGVSLGLPLLWARRVGLRIYFSNPIKNKKKKPKKTNAPRSAEFLHSLILVHLPQARKFLDLRIRIRYTSHYLSYVVELMCAYDQPPFF